MSRKKVLIFSVNFMNESLLAQLGMTKKEVKAYLRLLELGAARANTLAKGINENRTSTYSLLHSMLKKGLITFYKKNGVKYYSGVSPKVLIERFCERGKELKEILPQLLAITNQFEQKPKITFYEGLEGIQQIAATMLEVPDSLRYSFMGIEESRVHPDMKKYIEEEFLAQRIAKNISYRGIVSGYVPMAKGLEKTERSHLRELRRIDPKLFPLKIHVDTYPPDRVAIFSYHRDEMMGVIIEHASFYITMRSIFELAWLGVGSLKK